MLLHLRNASLSFWLPVSIENQAIKLDWFKPAKIRRTRENPRSIKALLFVLITNRTYLLQAGPITTYWLATLSTSNPS